MFKVNKLVPLSNQDLQLQVITFLQEVRRAREAGTDLREIHFEDQMNTALDTLAARYGATH